jgi:hypothetical protein
MPSPSHCHSTLLAWPVLILLLWCSHPPANGEGLPTVERTFPSYGHGLRTYTCLEIDGGIVPLVLPNDARLQPGDELEVLWPKERSTAIFRAASATEVALMNMIDKPEGPVSWKRYLATLIDNDSDQYAVRDFQTHLLDVNHWRVAAMAMDYSLLGVRSCCALLLWRCQDGSTITVILRSGYDDYKIRFRELTAIIGGAMLVPK